MSQLALRVSDNDVVDVEGRRRVARDSSVFGRTYALSHDPRALRPGKPRATSRVTSTKTWLRVGLARD